MHFTNHFIDTGDKKIFSRGRDAHTIIYSFDSKQLIENIQDMIAELLPEHDSKVSVWNLHFQTRNYGNTLVLSQCLL